MEEEKVNEKKDNKKKAKIGALVAAVPVLGLLLDFYQAGDKVYDYVSSRELRHHFGENAAYITDLSSEEQSELLEAFNITIPDSEDSAFISAFGKVDYNENYCVCFVEFDSVDKYEVFYEQNSYRAPSINQTTNADDMYLTYAERITPSADTEIQQLSVLFDEYQAVR